MKQSLPIVLIVLLALTSSACKGKSKQFVLLNNSNAIYFKQVKLIQKGYLWDTRYGDFDVFTQGGTVEVPRDFQGVRSIAFSDYELKDCQPATKTEQLFVDRGLIVAIDYKTGRHVYGVMLLHANRGWDYLRLETKEGTQSLPLYDVEKISFD
jgi:hypothetical protein